MQLCYVLFWVYLYEQLCALVYPHSQPRTSMFIVYSKLSVMKGIQCEKQGLKSVPEALVVCYYGYNGRDTSMFFLAEL